MILETVLSLLFGIFFGFGILFIFGHILYKKAYGSRHRWFRWASIASFAIAIVGTGITVMAYHLGA